MKPVALNGMQKQRGVTLIVALIFLAILTLLGISIARTTSMEERMAGNTRDRDLAFQAAEAALQDAAAGLPGLLANPFDGSTPGLENATGAPHANDQAYWNGYDWEGGSIEATTDLGDIDLANPPRYVIEKKPNTGPVATPTQHFRITARGEGASTNTVVILQAEYKYD